MILFYFFVFIFLWPLWGWPCQVRTVAWKLLGLVLQHLNFQARLLNRQDNMKMLNLVMVVIMMMTVAFPLWENQRKQIFISAAIFLLLFPPSRAKLILRPLFYAGKNKFLLSCIFSSVILLLLLFFNYSLCYAFCFVLFSFSLSPLRFSFSLVPHEDHLSLCIYFSNLSQFQSQHFCHLPSFSFPIWLWFFFCESQGVKYTRQYSALGPKIFFHLTVV